MGQEAIDAWIHKLLEQALILNKKIDFLCFWNNIQL